MLTLHIFCCSFQCHLLYGLYLLCCREIAVEILTQESDGAFLVRDSQSQPGCYVLSMKCPAKPGEKNGSIANFLIVRTAMGVNLKVSMWLNESGGRVDEGSRLSGKKMVQLVILRGGGWMDWCLECTS